ncbi:Flavin monooxygenase-like [Trema orientale]|uniref:Flavin-containing monooxygenase n=1 Tax=Trema orientale TaxID=63057 RepID=A0A2P5BLQ9_TREOI|nr:Flavin monooxygenase-like [Trema orientale]
MTRGSDSVSRQSFEAVVVCTGNFVEPEIPVLVGIEKWPGFQIHSHNYRVSEQFRGQTRAIDEVLFCNQGLIFNTIELQSKWVARVLSRKLLLPNIEEMMTSTNDFYRQMQDYGLPKRSTHFQTPYQIGYPNWLCAEIGLPPVEKWRYMMYEESILNIKEMRDGYKDQWDDAYWEGIIKESQVHGHEAEASE